MVGIALQPIRQFRMAGPIADRVQVALKLHVAYQQGGTQLRNLPVCTPPRTFSLQSEYLAVALRIRIG